MTRACLYEPEVNRSYRRMAEHYGTAVVPARPRKPRDKAKVESAVQVTERRILAPLRHRQFGQLGELNGALREELEKLNGRAFSRRPGSRRELFEELDRPALLPLPVRRYEHEDWKVVRAGRDHHVQVEGHAYSVPWQLAHSRLEARLTGQVVELFLRGERVAAHARSYVRGGATTLDAHRPKAHREQARWTVERLREWAQGNGPSTGRLVVGMLEGPRAAERERACVGIQRLAQRYGGERVEAAARRALHFGASGYRALRRILESGSDRERLEDIDAAPAGSGAAEHGNVRGAAYYGSESGRKENKVKRGGDEC